MRGTFLELFLEETGFGLRPEAKKGRMKSKKYQVSQEKNPYTPHNRKERMPLTMMQRHMQKSARCTELRSEPEQRLLSHGLLQARDKSS